jgi:hypothetical protein
MKNLLLSSGLRLCNGHLDALKQSSEGRQSAWRSLPQGIQHWRIQNVE